MDVQYPGLQEIVSSNSVIDIADAGSALITEIQSLLSEKQILHSKVDGVAGEITKKALAAFKDSVWLASPDKIGGSTAKALLEIAEGHKVSEQRQVTSVLSADKVGTKTGKTLNLPSGETVYAFQYIVPGIPLVWGEVTEGCDPERTPETNEVVHSIIKAAKGFGRIRDKYGSSLGINSGYRPPSVNRRVGGARYSQHINGLALDICPMDNNFKKLLEVCRTSDCVGLGRGMHRGFIHIDYRDGDRVVFDYP